MFWNIPVSPPSWPPSSSYTRGPMTPHTTSSYTFEAPWHYTSSSPTRSPWHHTTSSLTHLRPHDTTHPHSLYTWGPMTQHTTSLLIPYILEAPQHHTTSSSYTFEAPWHHTSSFTHLRPHYTTHAPPITYLRPHDTTHLIPYTLKAPWHHTPHPLHTWGPMTPQTTSPSYIWLLWEVDEIKWELWDNWEAYGVMRPCLHMHTQICTMHTHAQ